MNRNKVIDQIQKMTPRREYAYRHLYCYLGGWRDNRKFSRIRKHNHRRKGGNYLKRKFNAIRKDTQELVRSEGMVYNTAEGVFL